MFIWNTFVVGLVSAAAEAHDVVVATMSPATTGATASVTYVAVTIVVSPPERGTQAQCAMVVRLMPNHKSPPPPPMKKLFI